MHALEPGPAAAHPWLQTACTCSRPRNLYPPSAFSSGLLCYGRASSCEDGRDVHGETRDTASMRPSKVEIRAAEGRTVPDIIAPHLQVLFCGINPGLYSAAVGHHFARPGNRFWKALHRGGFTHRVLEPFEEALLPSFGLGITSLVERATATADSLSQDELRAGAEAVRRKAHAYKPHCIAFLGVGAYRIAFGSARAQLGLQQSARYIGNALGVGNRSASIFLNNK